jgi:hypothetical protein
LLALHPPALHRMVIDEHQGTVAGQQVFGATAASEPRQVAQPAVAQRRGKPAP